MAKAAAEIDCSWRAEACREWGAELKELQHLVLDW